jgi:RNA 2',3'-cyclic 3'-phosphodiesterase
METSFADTARLFFAAWPGPAVQRALGDLGRSLQRECGGRAVPQHNIHLTLVFLGNVERALLHQLEVLAAATTATRFELRVGRAEYWRHNRIVWAGVEECPESLSVLVARLVEALAALGLRLDRRPYVPHITLVRDARRAPASSAVSTVAWPVSDLALVESVQQERGRVYEVLRRWPLADKA